jgi:hypothetical protein
VNPETRRRSEEMPASPRHVTRVETVLGGPPHLPLKALPVRPEDPLQATAIALSETMSTCVLTSCGSRPCVFATSRVGLSVKPRGAESETGLFGAVAALFCEIIGEFLSSARKARGPCTRHLEQRQRGQRTADPARVDGLPGGSAARRRARCRVRRPRAGSAPGFGPDKRHHPLRLTGGRGRREPTCSGTGLCGRVQALSGIDQLNRIRPPLDASHCAVEVPWRGTVEGTFDDLRHYQHRRVFETLSDLSRDSSVWTSPSELQSRSRRTAPLATAAAARVEDA